MTKTKDTKALLVVDPQRDFEPGGALAVPGGDEIMEGIAGLMRSHGSVVVTQDFHPPGHKSFASSHRGKKPFEKMVSAESQNGEQILWPDHCVRGTDGAGFDPRIPLDCATLILRKGERLNVDSYSAFKENDGEPTGLAGWMRERGLRDIEIVGLAADYCVAWSARDAKELGFNVTIHLALTRFIEPSEAERLRHIQGWKNAGIVVR